MEITVIIPPQIYSSRKYTSNTDCYLADAIHEIGYEDVSVFGLGNTRITIDGVERFFKPKSSFSSDVLKEAFAKGVPLKVTLIER